MIMPVLAAVSQATLLLRRNEREGKTRRCCSKRSNETVLQRAPVGILRKAGVKDGIRDLVADLVLQIPSGINSVCT
jgi:hypothetical protein